MCWARYKLFRQSALRPVRFQIRGGLWNCCPVVAPFLGRTVSEPGNVQAKHLRLCPPVRRTRSFASTPAELAVLGAAPGRKALDRALQPRHRNCAIRKTPHAAAELAGPLLTPTSHIALQIEGATEVGAANDLPGSGRYGTHRFSGLHRLGPHAAPRRHLAPAVDPIALIGTDVVCSGAQGTDIANRSHWNRHHPNI